MNTDHRTKIIAGWVSLLTAMLISLAATAEAVRRFHDPSPGAMVRVAVAPCSPFSVSSRLMRETAKLARELGVRMHTHLAETREEDMYCRQTLGRTPAEDLAMLQDLRMPIAVLSKAL